ncbi:MAG: alpha/beta hydrolase [Actinomycetota bacterium]
MASRYHPDLRGRITLLKLLPGLTEKNLLSRRKMIARRPTKVREGVAVDDTAVGSVPIRTYRPAASGTDVLPTMIWLHGGGMVMGVHTDNAHCSRFADELGIAVVSVDYRLAPEHPYPAAIEDILAVVDWITAEGAANGFDRSRLAIGGASAGGGLTASAVQHLHDRGDAVLGQLLIYPMLDDRTVTRTDIGAKEHVLWDNRANEVGWGSYLGVAAGDARVTDTAVPARRPDLAGLPPAWIGVGTADLFHDEDVAYADRLREADVDCERVVVDGMIHGFDILAAKGDAAKGFKASQERFLQRVLGLAGGAAS